MKSIYEKAKYDLTMNEKMKELFSRERAGNILKHNKWSTGYWYIYKKDGIYFLERTEHTFVNRINRKHTAIEIEHLKNNQQVYEMIEELIKELER